MSAIRCYVCGVPLLSLLAAIGRRRCQRCIDKAKLEEARRSVERAAIREARQTVRRLSAAKPLGARPERSEGYPAAVADEVRNLRCVHVVRCLSVADAADWPAFVCGAGCKAHREQDAAQDRQDADGIAEMIAAAVRA